MSIGATDYSECNIDEKIYVISTECLWLCCINGMWFFINCISSIYIYMRRCDINWKNVTALFNFICNLTQVHMLCLSLQSYLWHTYTCCVNVGTYDSTGTYCSLVMKPFCEKVKVLFFASRWRLFTASIMMRIINRCDRGTKNLSF